MLYLERKAALLDMLGNFEIDTTEKKSQQVVDLKTKKDRCDGAKLLAM